MLLELRLLVAESFIKLAKIFHKQTCTGKNLLNFSVPIVWKYEEISVELLWHRFHVGLE